MSDRRSRDGHRKPDRRKNEGWGKQAPIILDRREKPTEVEATPTVERDIKPDTVMPFFKRPNKFHTETVKHLTDQPSHFVIGVIGKQGVGKSTILSHFTQNPSHTFDTQHNSQFLTEGHKTNGIDMYITPERAILLDTEPISCWSILDQALANGSLGGLPADLWLEMESIHNIIYLFSVCNVVLIVNEGPTVDLDVLQLLHRAEMLKFCIPDFPLLVRDQDMHYYPDVVFVGNKCTVQDFTWKNYHDLQLSLTSFFQQSQLKTTGLVGLDRVLPLFESKDKSNVFLLPEQNHTNIESFDVLVSALRDQVLAAPRRAGKKSQVSEKDWYRNAVKTYDVIRKSDYINEYLQIARKLRDS